MNAPLREIAACEVCGNTALLPVLNLGNHPLCDDLVPIGGDRICREYPIEILFCDQCITACHRFNVPKRDLFPDSYHYRARFTADVLKGMEGLVDSCVQQFGGLEGKRVLDIGCNDGSLLDFFRKRGALTFGIEPTGAADDAAEKGHTIVKDFLAPSIADALVATYGKPDFITFTNVFAHIENLQEVLDSLKILMHSQTVIVIENHYLGAILGGNQFDTFYHEHPRTYSLTSFKHIARYLGMMVLKAEFPARYGGNIRVFLANVGQNRTDIPAVDESNFAEKFCIMATNMACWQHAKKAQLNEQARKSGAFRAKAFPGRAAILIKLLVLDETMISAVYEKPGSMKIGHYVPGTRIPILSDEVLFGEADQSAPILNLAWHIPKEIRSYLSANLYRGEVTDIIEPGDFRAA